MAEQNAQGFTIPVNFAGIDPWDPTKGGVNDPEPGVYTGKVTAAVLHTKASDPSKQSIKVTVDLAGAGETDLYLGLDFSKAANVRKMLTALASCGVDVVKLRAAGQVNLVPAWFMGKDGKGAPCNVIVKAVEGVDAQGRKKLNDKEFATAEQAQAWASAQAGAASATAGTAGASTPPAGGAAAGGGAVGALFS